MYFVFSWCINIKCTAHALAERYSRAKYGDSLYSKAPGLTIASHHLLKQTSLLACSVFNKWSKINCPIHALAATQG